MTRPLIEFHTDRPDDFPAPYPAGRAVPQWLKDMPMQQPVAPELRETPDVDMAGTVKRCPPFLEAMACGYIIPLADDVTFNLTSPGQLSWSAPRVKVIGTQHPLEVKGSPFEGKMIVKFMNPWLVRTPPGYSTLFVPLLNQFQLPFQVLSGLVETDTYYREVHFPSICLMQPGTTLTLARGTPIVQAIPMRREDWQSSEGKSDPAARQKAEQAFQVSRVGYYKEHHWQKKGFD